METALVLRGPFGAGKTKIGEVMGSLIGERITCWSPSPRYITGQFNSHMASLLVLHADEAFWAGDKASDGTLKDLVIGQDITCSNTRASTRSGSRTSSGCS